MTTEPKLGPNRGNAGKGRPKGSPNKATRAVKEALNAVYDDLQQEAAKGGGMGENPHLLTWAKDNPTEFYKLWVKMLPSDVNANVKGEVSIIQLVGVRPGDSR